MAAMEAVEIPSIQFDPPPAHQTLTEISDDEIDLPPSDDEDDAAAKKEHSTLGTEGDVTGDEEALKLDPQENGVMVLALLDKIIGAVDQIQQTQNGLETRQQDMERTVSSIQGELTKLSKTHSTTSNSVNKMMEKVRKVSVNVKTVRANLEKQGGQIKKLENNEAELLKRRNFKVMIYQDEVKVASKLSIAKSMKVSDGASVRGSKAGSMLELKEAAEELEELEVTEEAEKEDKPHVDLSSDEEEFGGELEEETIKETRAERIKRSSLQRVQTLKTVFSKDKMDKTKANTKASMEKTKASMEKTKQKTKDNIEKTKQKTKANYEKTKENFEKSKQKTKDNLAKTKQNIEKKMGTLGTKMTVNPERKQKMQTSREKVKKSFTPDHVVFARDKTAVYKVPPFTFHVKKIRGGAVEVVQATEMVEVSQDGEPFNGVEVDEEVEEGCEEVEMEMMNGGAEEDEVDDEDEEEDEDAPHKNKEDRDRDSD